MEKCIRCGYKCTEQRCEVVCHNCGAINADCSDA